MAQQGSDQHGRGQPRVGRPRLRLGLGQGGPDGSEIDVIQRGGWAGAEHLAGDHYQKIPQLPGRAGPVAERGDIVFPKSVTPDRIRQNIDILDFRLSAAGLKAISALNRNDRTGPDPDTFDAL